MIRHHSHNLPNNLLSNALQMNGKRSVTYDFFFPSFEMKIQTNDSSKEFIGFFRGDFISTIISFQTSFLTEKPGSSPTRDLVCKKFKFVGINFIKISRV